MSSIGVRWDKTAVPKRVRLCHKISLSGQYASKSWIDLPKVAKQAILSHLTSKGQAEPPATTPAPQKHMDYVMWVGTKYYPTYKEFAAEAEQQGVCKRIGNLLKRLELGKSRVFLAHDEGILGQGFIFGYFVVERTERVVNEPLTKYTDETSPADLYTLVKLKALSEEPWRKPGCRKEGFYLVGSQFKLLKNFVRFKYVRFRGALKVNGEAILGSREFVKAPSDSHKKPKKLHWAKDDMRALIRFVKDSPDSARMACTQFALETGRTKPSVLYMYQRILVARRKRRAERE